MAGEETTIGTPSNEEIPPPPAYELPVFVEQGRSDLAAVRARMREATPGSLAQHQAQMDAIVVALALSRNVLAAVVERAEALERLVPADEGSDIGGTEDAEGDPFDETWEDREVDECGQCLARDSSLT